MMPKNGSYARAEQLATLEEFIHNLKTDKRIPNWIESVHSYKKLSKIQMANLNEISKIYRNASKVPKELSVELAKTTALAQDSWANARRKNQPEDLIPLLKKIIDLKRSEADCLRETNQDRYEALLQKFEPYQSNNDLKVTLKSIREPLKELREKILSKKDPTKEIKGKFNRNLQINMSKEIAKDLCFDFDSGRLDESLHPFSSGYRTDARITTRVDESNPLSCVSSVMHEVGHALYEQGIPETLYGQPIGTWCSMGFHESQSRLIENQIGRSQAFCEYLFPIIKRYFPNLDLSNSEELYRAANNVCPNYIRVDSDEVNYNLHILIRYELEEELILEKIEVEQLEEEWNSRFYKDFDMKIKTPDQGYLQDIHWSSGLFGYFPTYSLGNLYAANLFKKMGKEIKDLEEDIKTGQFKETVKWLRKKIHNKGRTVTPTELIKNATGVPVSTEPFLEYLNLKFTKLYGL